DDSRRARAARRTDGGGLVVRARRAAAVRVLDFPVPVAMGDLAAIPRRRVSPRARPRPDAPGSSCRDLVSAQAVCRVLLDGAVRDLCGAVGGMGRAISVRDAG